MGDFSNAMGLGFADSGGLNKLFQGLITGDAIRQKAELDAAMKSAQAYHHNMAGNVQSVKADADKLTFNNRQNIDDLIASNPQFAQNLQTAMKVWATTGKGDPHNISQASGDFQKQQSIADIQAGANPLPTSQGYAAVSGKMPFANAKADGYSLNGLTGQQIEGNPVVAKLYQGLQSAKTSHERASAGAAGALAGLRNEQTKEVKQGKLVDGTDNDGNPITFRIGTGGKVEVIEGVKPQAGGGLKIGNVKKNAEIDAARGILQSMTQDEVEALEKKDSFSLTAGDKAKLAAIKLAKTAKFGEDAVPTLSAQPAKEKPKKEGALSAIVNKVFGNSEAKAAAPDASKMQKANQIREQYQKGEITRDQAKQQLQTLNL